MTNVENLLFLLKTQDDNDLVDRATLKDRSWDAWKDDHPKGVGNKANKRF